MRYQGKKAPVPSSAGSQNLIDIKGVLNILLFGSVLGIFAVEAALLLELQLSSKTPANADFMAFFAAARMVVSGLGDQLYSMDAQAFWQQQVVGSSIGGVLPYYHPPFQIIAYLPLTLMPLRWAYWVWNAISLGIMAVSLIVFSSCLKPASWRVNLLRWLACLSFFPTVAILILGQDSALLLLIFVAVFSDSKHGKEGRAGAILALGLFRPQLVVIPVLILLFQRRWKAFGYFCVVAAALISVSLLMVGWQGGLDYIALVMKAATFEDQYGIFPSKMNNLKAFFYLILSPDQRPLLIPALILATSGFLTLLFSVFRGPWQPSMRVFDLKFSVLILATLLVSPHLYIHDLVLLIIPGLLVLDHCTCEGSKVGGRPLRFGVPLGYVAILSSFLYSTVIHFQIGVAFMGISVILLAYEIARVRRRDGGLDAVGA